MMEIKRDLYLEKLIRHKHNGIIKVITGIRRCGKSYLLFELFYNHLLSTGVKEDHIIKIALDDRINKKCKKKGNDHEKVLAADSGKSGRSVL